MPSLKTRQKVGAALVMFVIIFVFIELLMGGEPRTLKVPAGLVELRLPSTPASADVTWEAREPITQQFKTYENGTVLVTYLAAGQVVFSSDIIDWDARTRDKTTWIVQVEGPTPPKPPDPKPDDPKPPQPDGPAPIPEPGFRVLVVYESATLSALPAEQRAILFDADIRAFMTEKCVKVNNVAEWRMVDQHVPIASTSPVWEQAFKRPRASVPWLIVSNGKTGYEGPLPANKPEMLDVLRRYSQ